ncbi:hypothetical protein HOD38_04200 [archaeon]|mgnify:CR=1 FL=1|jgi:hypothetical protein|nr:hypothetical protein [archaeon]MBT4397443.1 hypothetical protein [archaeon]MBT4440515.1 hypothetical protein [archaeon]
MAKKSVTDVGVNVRKRGDTTDHPVPDKTFAVENSTYDFTFNYKDADGNDHTKAFPMDVDVRVPTGDTKIFFRQQPNREVLGNDIPLSWDFTGAEPRSYRVFVSDDDSDAKKIHVADFPNTQKSWDGKDLGLRLDKNTNLRFSIYAIAEDNSEIDTINDLSIHFEVINYGLQFEKYPDHFVDAKDTIDIEWSSSTSRFPNKVRVFWRRTGEARYNGIKDYTTPAGGSLPTSDILDLGNYTFPQDVDLELGIAALNSSNNIIEGTIALSPIFQVRKAKSYKLRFGRTSYNNGDELTIGTPVSVEWSTSTRDIPTQIGLAITDHPIDLVNGGSPTYEELIPSVAYISNHNWVVDDFSGKFKAGDLLYFVVYAIHGGNPVVGSHAISPPFKIKSETNYGLVFESPRLGDPLLRKIEDEKIEVQWNCAKAPPGGVRLLTVSGATESLQGEYGCRRGRNPVVRLDADVFARARDLRFALVPLDGTTPVTSQKVYSGDFRVDDKPVTYNLQFTQQPTPNPVEEGKSVNVGWTCTPEADVELWVYNVSDTSKTEGIRLMNPRDSPNNASWVADSRLGINEDLKFALVVRAPSGDIQETSDRFKIVPAGGGGGSHSIKITGIAANDLITTAPQTIGWEIEGFSSGFTPAVAIPVKVEYLSATLTGGSPVLISNVNSGLISNTSWDGIPFQAADITDVYIKVSAEQPSLSLSHVEAMVGPITLKGSGAGPGPGPGTGGAVNVTVNPVINVEGASIGDVTNTVTNDFSQVLEAFLGELGNAGGGTGDPTIIQNIIDLRVQVAELKGQIDNTNTQLTQVNNQLQLIQNLLQQLNTNNAANPQIINEINIHDLLGNITQSLNSNIENINNNENRQSQQQSGGLTSIWGMFGNYKRKKDLSSVTFVFQYSNVRGQLTTRFNQMESVMEEVSLKPDVGATVQKDRQVAEAVYRELTSEQEDMRQYFDGLYEVFKLINSYGGQRKMNPQEVEKRLDNYELLRSDLKRAGVDGTSFVQNLDGYIYGDQNIKKRKDKKKLIAMVVRARNGIARYLAALNRININLQKANLPQVDISEIKEK